MGLASTSVGNWPDSHIWSKLQLHVNPPIIVVVGEQ